MADSAETVPKKKKKRQPKLAGAPESAVVPVAATAAPARSAQSAARPNGQDPERALGRIVGIALPAGSVAIAIVVAVIFSVGPALLILVAGTLLGTIALFWASIRTLSGDAPLPEQMEQIV